MSDSEYFTYSALTTARMVWPSYGRAAPTEGTREPVSATSPTSTTTATITSAARRMTTSLDGSLALGSAESQAFHEIALQHEGNGEGGQHSEDDGGEEEGAEVLVVQPYLLEKNEGGDDGGEGGQQAKDKKDRAKHPPAEAPARDRVRRRQAHHQRGQHAERRDHETIREVARA